MLTDAQAWLAQIEAADDSDSTLERIFFEIDDALVAGQHELVDAVLHRALDRRDPLGTTKCMALLTITRSSFDKLHHRRAFVDVCRDAWPKFRTLHEPHDGPSFYLIWKPPHAE